MEQNSYTGFAHVYDRFMDDVPYRHWAEQTCKILNEQGIHTGIIADLGCGTGVFTELLNACGFDMIGIDSSEDMLGIAMERANGNGILYLCQDMREFELYGTCTAIVSRCDSINYLQSTEDLYRVFYWVNNYLDPKAPFIFDCNSLYKYQEILGESTFAENRDFGSFIWENTFDTKSRINEYDLTLYIRRNILEADGVGAGGDTFDDAADRTGAEKGSVDATGAAANDTKDLYVRIEETHIQKAFTIEEIMEAASRAGLEFGFVKDADTDGDVREETERYLFCFFENGK